MNIKLDLHMLSDWMVGTGTGVPGYADRLVQRDTRDASRAPAAPIVPAKTLIGVWRDSCELAAHALDSGPSGVWHDWLDFLFGGQYDADRRHAVRPAALALDGALCLPGRLPELLRGRPEVAWAATFRKPGVAVDPKTGTAETGMLRYEEMSRAGVRLTGRVLIRGFDELEREQRDAAVALLAAGARLLERLGGKRRRGSGRCRLALREVEPDFAVLTRTDIPAPPQDMPYAVADRPAPVPAVAGDGWECADLVITVEQPVLAAATVQGNLVRGEAFIPGWCLMPEVARRLGGPAHALVRTGDLVVTAATPQSAGGVRTLPVPKAFVHAKGNKGVVAGNRMAGDTAQGKSYRDGHVVPEGEEAGEVVSPHFSLRMHNTIRDDLQRPNRDVGGVYIYKALAAGSVLHAKVRVRSGLMEPGWQKQLSGRWRVGRSAKDDYGQVLVEARPGALPNGTRYDPSAPRTYEGTAPSAADGEGDLLRIWLLSELLVRDSRLRFSTDPRDVGRALEQALARAGAPGLTLTPLTEPRGGRIQVALGAHRTESWHRGWGLPRHTLYGLAAGSCLTFMASGGPIPPEALDEVRAAGVGERRAEGFGQVEIDHDLLFRSADGMTPHGVPGNEPAPPAAIAPGEDGHAEARIFERAAWRAEIHRTCEAVMAHCDRRAELLPVTVTSTQLNGLREVVREPSMERARNRLARLTRSKKGRPSWPEKRAELLAALLTEPDHIWTLLGLPEERLTVTVDGATSLRADLHDEAVRVLLTACVAAHSRERAKGEGE
ncbi:RAMP superfamily CRISPR-associated protein [Microtetraspora fusca]|uniref:RAMP superfamily CRISPR-associated protein n=1 Tax=Microtetraspora fusca TaxID=1997 RepID=UPI00082E5B7F|nr:RAMP superfamily CRISPR-associated protein [Microtetraspora fusca]